MDGWIGTGLSFNNFIHCLLKGIKAGNKYINKHSGTFDGIANIYYPYPMGVK